MVAADLAWQIHLSETQVWQREAVILEVSVQTPDAFARLRVDKLKIDGADVVALPFMREDSPSRQIDQKSTGQQVDTNKILRLRWRIMPHYAGLKTIQLPLIRYFLNGAKKAQWQAPEQKLEVQALPPYFPPTLPIGLVNIDSYIEPKGLLNPNHLAYWHITLHSKTLTPTQFPPLLKQIQTNNNLQILPATLSTQTSFASASFKQHYLIPFKPKHNGRLDLPELQWHWFNPQTGRLQQQYYQAKRPLVLATEWQITLGLILSLISVFVGYRVLRRAYRTYQRYSSRRHLQKLLQQPTQVAAIRAAMQECAKLHHWPQNLSIQQWLQYWDKAYGEDHNLHKAIRKFEQRSYRIKNNRHDKI